MLKRSKGALLVVAVEGKFYKKATGKTYFHCKEGKLMQETIQKAIDTGEPQTIRALSSGYNDQNELMAEFWVTWSFKKKASLRFDVVSLMFEFNVK